MSNAPSLPCRVAPRQDRLATSVSKHLQRQVLFFLSAQNPSQMASDGEGCDYRARPQSTPMNKKNSLDNIQASLLATGHMSQFRAMIKKPR